MAQATATARYIDNEEEEEDDEDVCRICRTPGDADNPLQYPCVCRGSIKFVHQDCLLQWLNYSKAHQCEVSLLLLNRFIIDVVAVPQKKKPCAGLQASFFIHTAL